MERSVKKNLFAMVMAFVVVSLAPFSTASLTAGYAPLEAAERTADNSMKRVTIIIKKLRNAMASMKDFDELEQAGLAKKDVDRMRRAMNDKIQQMMEDAIYAIRAL